MIRVDGNEIKVTKSEDGTQIVDTDALKKSVSTSNDIYMKSVASPDTYEIVVKWSWDGDESEIFTLWIVSQYLHDYTYNNKIPIELILSYCPCSNQLSSGSIMSFKYLAKLINLMGFDKVHILDAFSDLTEELLNRSVSSNHLATLDEAKEYIDKYFNNEPYQVVFTDMITYKKYLPQLIRKYPHCSVVYKNDGSYGIANVTDTEYKNALIILNTCINNKELVEIAKMLRANGYTNIAVCASHCSLKGATKNGITNYVNKIITTDTLFTSKDKNYIKTNDTNIQVIIDTRPIKLGIDPPESEAPTDISSTINSVLNSLFGTESSDEDTSDPDESDISFSVPDESIEIIKNINTNDNE